jgi:hypothetical protein
MFVPLRYFMHSGRWDCMLSWRSYSCEDPNFVKGD